MKNFKTTLFLASALLGAFGLLSFRPVLDAVGDSDKLYCDSTEKSELVVFLCDSTETDSLTLTNALILALNDSTETDSLVASSALVYAGCDTTETKTDDDGDTKELINMYVLNSFASDSTEVDSVNAV